MKVSLQVALAALIVVGCLIPWTFGQQPTPAYSPYRPTAMPHGYQAIADTTPDGTQKVIVISPDGKIIAELPVATTSGSSAGVKSKMRPSLGSSMGAPPQAGTVFTPDGGSGRLGGPSTMMPGGAAGMSPGMPGMGMLDPESEEEAAREAQTLTTQLRSTLLDEKQRAEVIAKLREALNRQFDLQQKRRDLEVGKIEERLGKLKETMKKREEAKETIISRRLDELSGATDDLGWEETEIRIRARGDGAGAGSGFGTSDYRVPEAHPVAPRVLPGSPPKPGR